MEIMLITVLLGPLAIALVAMAQGFSPVARMDVQAFMDRYGVPSTDQAGRLVRRYLTRTRRYRSAWALVGVAAATMFGITWFDGIYFGYNKHSPVADTVLMGLSGWLIGLVQAEGYNRRPRYHGPRMASLATRSDDRYRAPRFTVASRVAAAVCAVVGVGSVLTVSATGRPQVLVLVVASIVVVISVERCQRGIVRRARVVSSPDLMAVDEAIRSVAAHAVDLGSTGVLLLITGWELSRVGIDLRESSPSVANVLLVCSAGLLAVSIALAWRARRLIRPSGRRRAAPTNAQHGPLIPAPPAPTANP